MAPSKSQYIRKPNHTDQYLHWQSNHPAQHKLSVVASLHHRAMSVIREEKDQQEELAHVTSALKTCGYPDWTLRPRANTTQHEVTQPELQAVQQQSADVHVSYTRKPPIPLPYVKGVSEQLRRTFKDHGVDCYFKPTNCLRQLLCSPKDPTKKGDTVGAIYHVRCLGSTGVDCDSTYIGETERTLAKRIAEHLRPSSVTKSEVATHIHKDCPHHSVSMETVAVLDRDKDWYRRGVREAIYIRVNKPDLNRDQGRTRLSHSWDPLLQSRVSEFKRPRPRDCSHCDQGSS